MNICLNCSKKFKEWDEFFFYWCTRCFDLYISYLPEEELAGPEVTTTNSGTEIYWYPAPPPPPDGEIWS
jgi:hypothetical protein